MVWRSAARIVGGIQTWRDNQGGEPGGYPWRRHSGTQKDAVLDAIDSGQLPGQIGE